MKVVCDTNVLVSGSLFGGHPREILRLAAQGTIHNYASPDIFHELEDVLLRPKFGLTPTQVNGVLQIYRSLFETTVPSIRVFELETDPEDNKILEAALSARVDYIISGDRDLLDLETWRGIRVTSPADFIMKIMGR